jgi:hypothetical protein
MRCSLVAILAGLSLSACAAGKPPPVSRVTCFHWALWLKDGLVRPGLDRGTVDRIRQHFGIPREWAGKMLCSSGPEGQRWECYVEDHSCDRGNLPPGTVRVIYRSKEGTSTGPAGPDDIPGHVWVVEWSGFHEAEAGRPLHPEVAPEGEVDPPVHRGREGDGGQHAAHGQ